MLIVKLHIYTSPMIIATIVMSVCQLMQVNLNPWILFQSETAI